MAIKIALILSVLLQFGASVLAFSLIRRTRFNISWILISVGFLFMAIRRSYELIIMFESGYNFGSLVSSWVAVVISLMMFIGTIYIRRIFNLQERIEKLRMENESRVLAAIIKTEEKERRSFAKEIHDGLGPILSAVKMAGSAINKSELGDTNRKIFIRIESAVDEAIVSVKEISNNLSPHILEKFGVDKALKSFIANLIAKECNITYSSNLAGKRYDDNLEVILYRVIGELLTNTIKHANADNIKISLFDEGNQFVLIYSDNGKGFSPEERASDGMGLSNIRSRIKSVNGDMELHSSPDEGFLLKLIIQL